MKNERQTKSQMAAWVIKDRWAPLLSWFNQNDTKQEHWTLLFGQARMYDFQDKWPHYLEFFQKHFDHKTHTNAPFVTQSVASDNAWKLMDIAMPAFFVQAAPLLTSEQRVEFRATAMQWMTPWLPAVGAPMSIHQRMAVSTLFRTLMSFDAFDEWKSLEKSVPKDHIGRIVQYTQGKDRRWSDSIRQLHLGQGNSEKSWGVVLLKSDCVEHLLAEKTPLPVANAFLDCALEEQQNRNNKSEEAIAMAFRRYPHFRVWAQQGQGDDAQTCRAIVGIPEEGPLCSAALSIQMAQGLGLPLSEFSALLLQKTALQDDMDVDTGVFDEASMPR